MEQAKWHHLEITYSVFIAAALFAANVSAADGPRVSPADMRAIYMAADLKQKEKGGNWTNSCGEPAPDKSEVVDLDGKGKPGVLLYVSGSCLHWEGSHFRLFVKADDGRWKDALGVAAQRYKLLPVRHHKHFDFEVINVGSAANAPDSTYCWNGQRYVYASLNRCGKPG